MKTIEKKSIVHKYLENWSSLGKEALKGNSTLAPVIWSSNTFVESFWVCPLILFTGDEQGLTAADVTLYTL